MFSYLLHRLGLFCLTLEFIYHTHVFLLSVIHSTPTHINHSYTITHNSTTAFTHTHLVYQSTTLTQTSVYHTHISCHSVNHLNHSLINVYS
uniref:Uncharacterized protein n=1 Tax=Octopus bimaculoides TaxID=37653 RepID=A0A0L8GGH1_OCTBM